MSISLRVATTSVIFLHFSSLLRPKYRLCRVISRPHSTLDESASEQLPSFEIIPPVCHFLWNVIDNPASPASLSNGPENRKDYRERKIK